MIARLLAYFRAYWAWLLEMDRLARTDDALYAADTADLRAYDARVAYRHPSPQDCTTFDCGVCLARASHSGIGRQPIEGDAIKDIAAWLQANGWGDVDRGELQQYACWLRRARATYEATEVLAS